VVGLVAALAAGPAIAVDIRNEDRVDHDAVIIEEGVGFRLLLTAGETESDVCGACRIAIERVGTIEAEGADVVVIKDRALSR